jgi:DNA-binding transcriptional ArsR family regulator
VAKRAGRRDTGPVPPPAAGGLAAGGWRPGGLAAERPDQLDEVLSAVAGPTRRRLLEELAFRGAATATALARDLPISRQAVVKHLAVLSQAGLADKNRQGREVSYVARPEGLAATARQLAGLAAEWDRRLGEIRQIAESQRGE